MVVVSGEALNLAAGFGFNGYDSKGHPQWDMLRNVSIWDVEVVKYCLCEEFLSIWDLRVMNIGEAVEQRGKLCDRVEAVGAFTYLGDMVSAGGGCEAARERCGWVKFRECGELLYGRRFPLRLKGAIYESYVRPAMLYGSEA